MAHSPRNSLQPSLFERRAIHLINKLPEEKRVQLHRVRLVE